MIYKKVSLWAESLTRILIKEFPFIIISAFLIGYSNITGFVCYFNKTDIMPLTMQFENVARTFFIVFLFATIIHLSKSKFLKLLLYSTFILLFSTQRFLVYNFEITISPNVFILLAETNKSESSDFIKTFALTHGSILTYIQTFFVIIFTWFLERWWSKRNRILENKKIRKWVAIPLLLFLSLGIYSMNIWKDLFLCNDTEELASWDDASYAKFTDLITKSAYSLWGINISGKEIQNAVKNTLLLDKTQIHSEEKDSLNIVLVIGESYIKYHAGLYGYYLNTTPNMKKEMEKGNLYKFDDVVSPYNITTPTIKNLLSCNSISDGELWANFPFFPTILKKSGFDVFIWDNQKQMDRSKAYTFALNSYLYNNHIETNSYTSMNNKSYKYDGELVQSFIDSYPKGLNNKHNFIIFHFVGQHVSAYSRYPHKKEFDYFTKDSIKNNAPYITDKKRQEIADYDNATLYNDFVMGMIFDYFKNTNCVLLYLSDHGEEAYDYRDNIGRKTGDNINENLVKYQFQIPFIIWTSDKFKMNNPETIKNIINSREKKYMSDNICQILFGLGKIQTSFYKRERDLLNPNYIQRKRIILDKFDIDNMTSN